MKATGAESLRGSVSLAEVLGLDTFMIVPSTMTIHDKSKSGFQRSVELL